MVQRLGDGEYERADVEVRQSTLEARYIFLETLFKKKSSWAFDLVKLFNSKEIQKNLLETDQIDKTSYFFFPFLLRKKVHEIEISREIIDTPLLQYYSFIFDKIERADRRALNSRDPVEDRCKAIRKIIPNWQALEGRNGSRSLCQAIQTWGKENHLIDEWCLNFALDILCRFKSRFDFILLNFNEADLTPQNVNMWIHKYESEMEEAVSNAVSGYAEDQLWDNLKSGLEDLDEMSAFEYSWRDFDLPRQTWFPRSTPRKEFCTEARNALREHIRFLQEASRTYGYSNGDELHRLLEKRRAWLEGYCDHTDQSRSKTSKEIKPAGFADLGEFPWFYHDKTRKQFIEETLSELERLIVKIHKSLRSLGTFKKKHFETRLTKYCNEIVKAKPENWVKTPQKYSEERHFEWLVDFQIPPCKSYTQIAKEYSVDIKTVRGAIQNLAKIVGISLRRPMIGRPKGTRDSETALRRLRNPQKAKSVGF